MDGDRTTSAMTTTRPVLHLWGISPFGYKVLMAAAHKCVALETRLATFPAMMESQKRTGKRKTPFLVVGDRWITDSTAICRYLEENFDGPSLFPADRAECDLVEDWADEGLNRAAEPWIWVGGNRLQVLPKLCADEQTHRLTHYAFVLMRGYMKRMWTARAKAHGSVDACRQQLCAQMDIVERRLDERPWLFGDAPTVADFAIAGQLANLVRFNGAEDLNQRPKLSSMVRRAVSVLDWVRA
jgi:glutathione S-transferase